MLSTLNTLFLQIPGANQPGEQSVDIVKNAFNLSKETAAQWNAVWIEVFNPQQSSLWIALVRIGFALSAVSILYMIMTTGKQIIDKQSWSDLIAMLVWPLVIAIFLANGGTLLARTVLAVRSVGHTYTQQILSLQQGELTYRDAISRVGISSVSKNLIQAIYKHCDKYTGEELVACWKRHEPNINEILSEAEREANGPLPGLRKFATFALDRTAFGAIRMIANPSEYLRDNIIPIIQLVLGLLQWGFANILETSLLLTGLFAPIAMGLSCLPMQAKPIITWLSGMFSIFAIQMGYNIVVGLIAYVLVRTQLEVYSDLTFATFLALFAPTIAILIGRGGGAAIYNGLNSSVQQLFNFTQQVISMAVRAQLKRS